MGPWPHGGWHQEHSEKLGDISFGSDTAEFFDEIELAFFRHYLKDDPDPGLAKATVFKTGTNEWKKLDQWPPPTTPERLYFHARGKLAFDRPAGPDAFDEYMSDPNHPVPTFSAPTLTMKPGYMDADQRFAEKRGDVLTYSTEPLDRDITIAGPVSPNLYVATSATDSDFDVKLIDVLPSDGYEQLVRGEPFRGKFRHGFEHPEPFQPGAVEEIRFSMPDVYHCFRKGHRIMVQVESSWFPLTDRNPQTFTDIPFAKPEQFVKATEKIYHSSFVEIGVER
jgi:putative CocE/NonD family hydrolase